MKAEFHGSHQGLAKLDVEYGRFMRMVVWLHHRGTMLHVDGTTELGCHVRLQPLAGTCVEQSKHLRPMLQLCRPKGGPAGFWSGTSKDQGNSSDPCTPGK